MNTYLKVKETIIRKNKFGTTNKKIKISQNKTNSNSKAF